MLDKRTPSRSRMGIVLGSWSILVLALGGLARAQPSPEPIVEIKGPPPKDCKNLGEVEGEFWGVIRPEAARKEAFDEARKLGATHVQVVEEKTGQRGTYTSLYTGIAYRCPVPAAGPPGK